MYLSHFRLDREPFSLTPDPRFLFLSARHREALAHLLYGLEEKGGFVQLTGEVGTGKTTLCRSLLENVPAGVEVALVFNPRVTARELLEEVCGELKIEYPEATESQKVLVDRLNRHLLAAHAAGRRTVLIVDEAQQLSADVLEQIRLLSNLETSTAKLLQIVLIGQPELQTLMARPELRQLAQRITARYHLGPLTAADTAAYVAHRLAVAGCARPLFTPGALRMLHRRSRGIPRLVNVLCDRSLLGAYALGKDKAGTGIVRRAALEVEGRRASPRRWPAAAAVGLALAAGVVAWRALPGSWEGVRRLRPLAEAVPDEASRAAARVAPTPPALSAAEDFAAVLGDAEGAGAASAYRALFRLWQIADGESLGGSACDRAERVGLRCLLQGRGGDDDPRDYGLPAVLELAVGSRRRYAVLLASKGKGVTVSVGARTIETTWARVEPFWTGRFTLFWRAPAFGTPLLAAGVSGDEIEWLRGRLRRAGVGGGSGEETGRVFDEALRERVAQFQRAHGLRPDGRVGLETYIRLSAVAGDGTVPRLAAAGRAGG